jgi:hypothetical protein
MPLALARPVRGRRDRPALQLAAMEPDWTSIRARISALLDRYRGQLSADAVEGVEHYLQHDEYEMALEGLCIELLGLQELKPEDRRECRELGQALGLDRETVFDPTVWQRLSHD